MYAAERFYACIDQHQDGFVDLFCRRPGVSAQHLAIVEYMDLMLGLSSGSGLDTQVIP